MIKPFVSIIIPAYNEEKNLGSTLAIIREYLASRNFTYEILIINDGSTDHTQKIAQSLVSDNIKLLTHKHNWGKGAAVRTGMFAAEGDLRLFIDADNQIQIDYLDQALLKFKDGADVVIGSTHISFSRQLAFEPRYYLGSLAKWLIRILMVWNIKDTQRGFKAFTTRAANEIFSKQTITGWGFDIELLAIAKENNFIIAEIPVTYQLSNNTHVSSWSYLTALGDLIKIKLNTFIGVYSREHISAWKILLILVLPVLLFFTPVLFLGKIFFDGDALTVLYPYAFFAQHHASDIWNSYFLSGFPMISSVTSFGFYNPIAILIISHLGFITGYHLLVVVGFIGASLFTYWFSREIGFGQPAAVLVALVYTFNQWNAHWMSNVLLSNAILILPILFLSVQKIFNNRNSYAVLLGLGLGFGFISAHPQFIIMSIISALFYALYLTWQRWQSGRTWFNFRPLTFIVIGLLLGVFIGMSQIINSSIFKNLSTRNQGVNYQEAIDQSAIMPLDVLKYAIPHLTLRSFTAQEFYPYVGLLPLIFGFIAIIKLWKKDKRVRFFGAVFVGAILIAIRYSPIFWLMLKLPILEYFRGPSRWMMIGNFGLAVLAGIGFEYLIENNDEKIKLKILKFVRWISFIVLGIGLSATATYYIADNFIIKAFQDFFDAHLYVRTTHLPLSYYHDLITSIIRNSFSNILLTDPRFLIAVFFALLSWLMLYYFFKHHDNKKSVRMIIVMITVNLLVIGWVNNSFADKAILIEKPAIAEFIQNREQNPWNYRVFSFMINTASSQKITATHPGHIEEGFQYIFDGLGVNSNLLWDIPTVDGFDTIANRRGQKVFAEIGSEAVQSYLSLSNQPIPLDKKIDKFMQNLPLLSMLNVKYIVSAYQLPVSSQITLLQVFKETSFNIPLYLYQNNTFLPRIYFANLVSLVSSGDESKLFGLITNPQNSFLKRSFIECNNCSNGSVINLRDQLEIADYKEGVITIRTHTAGYRWLIISESNLPGWQVTIDDIPVSIYTANYIFQAVYIPSGRHTLIIKYHPPIY